MLSLRKNTAAFYAALITLIASVLAIAGAFYFQFVLHLPPCPLCLVQRWPFYTAIPLSAAAAWLARPASPSVSISRILLLIMAVGFLAGASVAIFHAGVEWKFWEGMDSCSGPLSIADNADDFLQRLQTTQVARCDEAAWRFAGLSIAGWNALLSLGISGIAAWGAFARPKR